MCPKCFKNWQFHSSCTIIFAFTVCNAQCNCFSVWARELRFFKTRSPFFSVNQSTGRHTRSTTNNHVFYYRIPQKIQPVQPQPQQPQPVLPLLNHNSRKRENSSSIKKWEEEEYTNDVLGYVCEQIFTKERKINVVFFRNILNPDDSKSRLLPDRVYKENRANWNGNYLTNRIPDHHQLPKQQQASANYSLPPFFEPMPPSRVWSNTKINNNNFVSNMSGNQRMLMNSRRVSGKLPGHYVIAQSPSQLPSRYTFKPILHLNWNITYFLFITSSKKSTSLLSRE